MAMNLKLPYIFLITAKKNGEKQSQAAGSTCLKQLKENIEYIVGIHADVTEDMPIKLTAYDGEKTDAEP